MENKIKRVAFTDGNHFFQAVSQIGIAYFGIVRDVQAGLRCFYSLI